MIVLRIVRQPDGAPPGQATRTVDPGGSTIGRAPDCDLVLDDPLRLVSRRHAWIAAQDGDAALLRCISTSATLLVNGEALPPNGERVVHAGDRLRIGGFEVQLEARASAPIAVPELALSESTVHVGSSAGSARPPPARPPRLDKWFDLDTVADPLGPGSPLPALGSAAALPEPARPGVSHGVAGLAPAAQLAEAAMARANALRDERVPVTQHAERAVRAPTPVDVPLSAAAEVAAEVAVEVAEPPGDDEPHALARAFLRGAGLEASTPLTLNPAWMEHVGALLRASLEGTLDMLRSRAVAKRGIGAEGTRIVARENNLLKFAPDAAEALRLLLNAGGRPGFLDPIDAVHDAHCDLRVHQLAMVAGMRAAVFELISRLGPEATERAEGPPRGLARHFPLLRDAALWRRHRHGHAQLLENLDDTFEVVFGREFLRAYEAQSRSVLDAGQSGERVRRRDHDGRP
jgi:type VI secretion system FHA domain protein